MTDLHEQLEDQINQLVHDYLVMSGMQVVDLVIINIPVQGKSEQYVRVDVRERYKGDL